MFEIVYFILHNTNTYVKGFMLITVHCTYNKLTTKLYECSKNGQIRNIGTCPHKLYLGFTNFFLELCIFISKHSL